MHLINKSRMFTKTSYIKRKLRGWFLRIFNAIENNRDCSFHKNGEEKFVDNLLDYYKKMNKDLVIFDIGANVGGYSLMLKQKQDKLNICVNKHLFEPTKKCFSILEENFKNDSLAVLNNFGASNIDSVENIYYDKETSSLASLYQRNLDYYDLALNESEKIQLKRLDNYIEKNNIKHIDFIKIDIEGHELKALEGLGSYLCGDFMDFIQFEYGGANLDSHTSLMEIYKFLNDRGFKIAKVMPKGLEIKQYAPYMDNFQYSNYVAISDKVLKN